MMDNTKDDIESPENVIKKRFFKCDLCNKEFAKNHNLKVHIRNVHEGKKLYRCEKCEKNYSQNADLKTHIQKIHENTVIEKKMFQCNLGILDHKLQSRGA